MSEALRAVEAEAVAPPEGVTVPLVTDDGSVDILVPPPSEWYEGAVEALTAGRTSDWVELALDPAMLSTWQATRKRYKHIDAFLSEWMRLTGENSGKSAGSSPSSRSTPKR